MTATAAQLRRFRGWLVIVTGTGAGASAVLALLVLAAVLVCVATPRASQSYRTQALRQLLATTTSADRAVTGSIDLPTLGGALGPLGSPEFSGMSGPTFGPIGAELAQNLRAKGLPLTPGNGWWSLATTFIPAPGAAKSAYFGDAPPVVELLDRSDLNKYARFAAGGPPATDTVGRNTARFDVAVTEATARRFSLRPGSVVKLSATQTGTVPNLLLTVTGILRPLDQGSAFWTADPDALNATFNKTTTGGYWLGGMFIGDAEANDLETVVASNTMQVTWEFPLALGGITANQAPALGTQLTSELPNAGVVTRSVITPLTLNMFSGLTDILTTFVITEGELGNVLALLYVSLAVVGLVVLMLGARLLAGRRAAEFGLIRARGGGRWQLAIFAARTAAVVVIPAALAGLLLAVAVTPGDGEPLAWWLAAITTLSALIAVPWLAVRRARGTGLSDERADSAPSRMSRLRLAVFDAGAVAVAIAGLVVLRLQGSPSGGTDWYTSTAPVLAAIPMAVVVVRLYPVVLRSLARLSGRRSAVAGFVGFARATRGSATTVLPVFALVLALSVIAFGAMLRTAVVSGDVAESWRAVGADAVVNASGSNSPITPAALRAIGAVPGVHVAAPVTVVAGTAGDGSTIGIVIITPASYDALVAQTPARHFPGAVLASRTGSSGGQSGLSGLPALASAGAAAAIGDKKLLVNVSLLPVNIVGSVKSTPAVPEDGPFIVVPMSAFDRAIPSARPTPNLVLITGPVDQARLRAVVGKYLPGATTITFRSTVLSALTGAVLPRGAYATFAQGAAAAAGFGVIIMLIMLALGARPRELTLARLFTMGLSRRQAGRLVVAEALPAILAATIGGAVCAWALVPLLSPSINLSPFTGTSVAVPLRADYLVIGYLAGCLIVLALGTLTAQAAATRLRGVSRALRVGE
jgi:putative ABC transport system permease protein